MGNPLGAWLTFTGVGDVKVTTQAGTFLMVRNGTVVPGPGIEPGKVKSVNFTDVTERPGALSYDCAMETAWVSEIGGLLNSGGINRA